MFVYFGIIACVFISGSNGRKRCATPSGVQGSCINLRYCDSLIKILRSYDPPDVQDIETLREWRCGFDRLARMPKVCCPDESQTYESSPKIYGAEKLHSVFWAQDLPDVTQHPNRRLINSRSCGPATSDKMLRGNRTTWDEFPWMALLGYQVDGAEDPVFKCGGTLITKRYVLTAAHCVVGLSPGEGLVRVRIGEHDLSQVTDCVDLGRFSYCADMHQDFLVQSVQVHEEYREINRENDIALIRIDGDAVLGVNVATSCLPVGNAAAPKFKMGLVTGWGATGTGIKYQTMLRGTMEIIPNEECVTIVKNGGPEVSYKQFCAMGRKEEDSCVGDSGGPFQGPGSNEGVHYFQYGIASYGSQHCMKRGAIVYTKVAYYVKWILDTITD